MAIVDSRFSARTGLAAAALALEFARSAAQFAPMVDTPPGMVDCGGHFESSCSLCPRGNGPTWCNGDCAWLLMPGSEGGSCVSTWAPGHTSETFWYMVGFLLSGMIMLCYACVYKQKVIVGPPPLPKVNTFLSGPRRGLFECFWYPDTCLYTLFCLPVVSAKNYYATDVCPFWPGCILTFIGTYSPFYCFTVCFRTILSGKVQEKLGREPNCCMDCIYNAFCFPCEVGRESLEVDSEIGAEITCCCKVKITPRIVAEVEQVIEKEERACAGNKYRMCGGQGH